MSIRIAVLSDSHIGQRISAYPADLLERLHDFDVIVHAGDHTSVASVELLDGLGDLRAVHGNMDEIAVRNELPSKLILDVEGMKIGVTHGWGAPIKLAERVRTVFEEDAPDIVIFGHSHIPFDGIIDGVRMLNPGAVSGNLLGKKASWGILTIDGRKAAWELVEFQP